MNNFWLLRKSSTAGKWILELPFCLFAFLVTLNANAQDTKQNKVADSNTIIFKCPPCNMYCDTIEFKEGGLCPVCNMVLFPTYKWGNSDSEQKDIYFINKTVGILLFPGVEIIDFTGPYEVFEAAGAKVITITEDGKSITAGGSLKITPDYSFDNFPGADIIVLPGGNVDDENQKIIQWVQKMNVSSEKLFSVCNGALFLSKAGLLDGLSATTFFGLIPRLERITPKAKISRQHRLVDNGHIITSAGLSAGIDAALHIVGTYLGTGRAQEIATNLEYNWDASEGYVRARLADQYIIEIRNLLSPFTEKTIWYSGNDAEWNIKIKMHHQLANKHIYELIKSLDPKNERWTSISENNVGNLWKYSNKEGVKGEMSMLFENNAEGNICTIRFNKK